MTTIHKKRAISIIAFMLVISTIITLPGFMVGVSAVRHSIPNKTVNLSDIENIDSITDLHFETLEGDGEQLLDFSTQPTAIPVFGGI